MRPLRVFGFSALFVTFGCLVSGGAEDLSDKPSSHRQPKVVRTSQERLQNSANPAVGLIPNDRYRADFGQDHRFHLSESSYGHLRHFSHGGYSFGFADEWPTNWLSSQDLFVVQIDGGYYLCNTAYPGVNIPLTIAH